LGGFVIENKIDKQNLKWGEDLFRQDLK